MIGESKFANFASREAQTVEKDPPLKRKCELLYGILIYQEMDRASLDVGTED